MTSPIERLAELTIGTVESISAEEVRALLDLDAPQSTALNTGTPTSFPRLNSYVLIPNEAGATVAYVTWIGIERSPFPKRSGFKDFGLIDLPFPLRKMSLTPIGTLTARRDRQGGSVYELSRGVIAFPSVGDPILIPTTEQVSAIVGARNKDRRVRIGASPLAANTAIMVDPDKIFGRHVAVLGNTGSGKSCSVAGLIRWSLDAAQAALQNGTARPNARFIILDPNGEYGKAFADRRSEVRLFRVPPVDVQRRERALRLPAWMWNGHEWTAVSFARPGAQRPLLLQALRELKSGNVEGVPPPAIFRRHLHSYRLMIDALLATGPSAFAGPAPGPRRQTGDLLDVIADDCLAKSSELGSEYEEILIEIGSTIKEVADSRRSNNGFFNSFSVQEIETARDALQRFLERVEDVFASAQTTEDAPIPFDVHMLPEHLERIASTEGGAVAGFISTLGMRIRGMMADPRLGHVVGSDPPLTFDAWLDDLIGSSAAENGQVAIVDLSLVPSEIVHVVVSVLARLTFEALQRYRRLNPDGKPLPTTLVLEEAHNFVRRGANDDGPAENPTQLCREIFEKIAREGRKFGLGLMLSSQRPSELSPTILAQCNTFLLHRIVNDLDQALVSRLVPDNVAGLLKELPSLPSRQAVLLGWAAPIPLLVEMDELAVEHRPQSSDPDFWDVWTGNSAREVDWSSLVADWTGAS